MKGLYLLLFSAVLALASPSNPVPTDLPGVANFRQVDSDVFRGAQPTDDGLRNLAKLGIKTIVDLRHGSEHADSERKIAELLGMNYINVPMEGLAAPTDRQIASLLTVLDAADHRPVFVHCREGKDRTGTVVACYRVEHDHWTNAKALEEAETFGLHADQRPRRNFILNFLPNLL